MRINVPLLREVLTRIQENPKLWYQGAWVRVLLNAPDPECGTAYCFAGWAAKLSGFSTHRMVWALNTGWTYLDDLPQSTRDAIMELRGLGGETLAVPFGADGVSVWQGNTVVHVSLIAQAVLGLDVAQAAELFDATNTMARLEEIVSELVEQQELQDADEWRAAAVLEIWDSVAEAQAILEEAALTEPALV